MKGLSLTSQVRVQMPWGKLVSVFSPILPRLPIRANFAILLTGRRLVRRESLRPGFLLCLPDLNTPADYFMKTATTIILGVWICAAMAVFNGSETKCMLAFFAACSVSGLVYIYEENQ